LEATVGGVALRLGPRKQQTVLAVLAVHAGSVVGVDELVDALWPERPPASAVANVRSYAASLRRLFTGVEEGGDRLVRRGSGYQLNADADELDLLAFSSLVAGGRDARRADDLAAAAKQLLAAVGCWRGPILAGLPAGPGLAARCAVVEEDRQAVVEELAEVQLALDEPVEAARLLHEHVRLHPLRERAYGLLMTALQRVGDVAGALSIYAEARTVLVDRLGIEPGRELQQLHRSILDGAQMEPSRSVAAADPRPVAEAPRVTDLRPAAKPAELPADLVDFVGRAEESEQAIAVLAASGTGVPVCCVVGQAGVGKTSLAVHVAHRVRAAYPDGQLFVDLRGADTHPLSSAEVLARFLRALGVPGQVVPHEVDERAALYRSLLADRRLLVVLDNAADEEQIRPLLPGTPSCAVLVTSRYRLTGLAGAGSVNLSVLRADGALALLDRTTGAGRVRAELAAARELARLCGGLPLALRVVGAKLAASPHRSLSVLVDRLTEDRHRLDQLSHAGLAVRSSLDFSYERVDPADRRLLRRVALLDAPDFAAWTAAAVADEPVAVVEEGLDRLIAAHLVQAVGVDVVGQVRYRMHDLIRLYARERAGAEDTDPDRLAAVRRTLHHWLGLATAGEESLYGNSYHARLGAQPGDQLGRAPLDAAAVDRVRADPLTWIEAERAGYVAAVRQAAGVGLFAECWRLGCLSMHMLSHRQFQDESRVVHTIAADAARRLGDRRGEATALMALGKIDSERGDWVDARTLLERAEAIYLAEGDRHGLAQCYSELALKDRYEGRLKAAQDRYTAMVDACGEHDPGLAALALRGLGQIQMFARNPAAALPLLESALEVSRQCAGSVPRMLVLRWCGEVWLELGDTERARTAFIEIASWSKRFGDPTGEVLGLAGQAHAALADGQLDEAERLAVNATDQYKVVQEPIIAGSLWLVLARVRLARQMFASARETTQQLLDQCRAVGNVVNRARALELLAEIHEAEGDPDAAATARAEAAALHP
jgi:DNA-binding SARP family transcriptional activator/tetratricopeptide (TPR) repeat protein